MHSLAMEKNPKLPPLPPLPRDTTTFSVRFTDEQKELIGKAAALRGWTPTNLLRVAALEKAAHILNAGTPNRVDYRDIARVVAEQVFEARSVLVPSPDSRPGSVVLYNADVFDDLETASWDKALNPVQVSPREKAPAFLQQLKEAARFGGTEFLALLIEACADIAARNQQLPDPVDPTAV
jgi:uncharacterized protein (DUF1778 family)